MEEEIIQSSDARHSLYYFDDRLAIFKVQDTLFKIHLHFLIRESHYFRTMFESLSTSDLLRGADDMHAIFLPKTTVSEFEALLDFFYFGTSKSCEWLHALSDLDTTGEGTRTEGTQVDPSVIRHWLDLLAIAHRYVFPNVRKTAIATIDTLGGVNPVEKLRLAQRYHIPAWRLPALAELCAIHDLQFQAEGR
ncbi:hypothetical protein H0H92_001022 [Tricholoma furcatifolium]|nr:hypothetical protein H0H92_001022 [Tricholoma furcatifolium]